MNLFSLGDQGSRLGGCPEVVEMQLLARLVRSMLLLNAAAQWSLGALIPQASYIP